MPLVDVELPIDEGPLPGDIRGFLREAQRRIEAFQRSARVPGFVPSDFVRSYHLLRALSADGLLPGNLFCEWGSGFGVVACLAALCDFDAHGIEIERSLVDAACQLAEEFGIPATFVHGSFIPRGGWACAPGSETYAWLTVDEGSVEEELGLAPGDFDLIFAYPWPDEEHLTAALFDRYAAPGSMLVTYHADTDFRLRRKTRGRPTSAKSLH
jgi:hypothetical protein